MTEPLYVLGHEGHELDRLALQGRFFEAITRTLFVAAGVAPGMRVLDLGCGAGDVSLLVADLVGPTGAVVGVDRSREALSSAEARVRRAGLSHVTFLETEFSRLPADHVFDALIGRFVLMHQSDPADTLRHAAALVRRGGSIAFLESVTGAWREGVHSHPHSPLYDRVTAWMVAAIRAAGANTQMGLALRSTFLDAGLPEPTLALEARVEGGPDSPIYRYTAESLRSMAPMIETFGIATPQEMALDTLEERLRDEVVASGGVLVSPLVVSAFAVK